LLIVFADASASAFAQNFTHASASEAFSPLIPSSSTPVPAPTRPATAHFVSPETAARLSIGAPKYVTPTAAKATTSTLDLRQTDHPRNAIIRLPNYIVRDPKAPVYSEDQFPTPEAKLQRTYARHRGLGIGSIGILKNDLAARQIQEDDERVERRGQTVDLLGLLPVDSDPAVGRSVRDQVRDTFMNSTTWLTMGGSLQQSREKHP
jgi:hypothetical protein